MKVGDEVRLTVQMVAMFRDPTLTEASGYVETIGTTPKGVPVCLVDWKNGPWQFSVPQLHGQSDLELVS